jgi:hypothetical protein
MVPDEVYVITIVPGRQFALSAAPISARDIEQQFPHFDVNLNSGEPTGSDSSLVSPRNRVVVGAARPTHVLLRPSRPGRWRRQRNPSLIRKKASLMSPFNSLLRSN